WAISPERFLDVFTEGRPGTMAEHVRHTGYFSRAMHELGRWLGTPPTVEAVVERRLAVGPGMARPAVGEPRITALLVDTGYPPGAGHPAVAARRGAGGLRGRARSTGGRRLPAPLRQGAPRHPLLRDPGGGDGDGAPAADSCGVGRS